MEKKKNAIHLHCSYVRIYFKVAEMESRETSELQQLVSSDAENEDSIVQDEPEGKIVSPVKNKVVNWFTFVTKVTSY